MKEIAIPRAEEITKLHNEIIGSLRNNLRKAVRIGELLTEQKEILPRGEWTKWMLKNLPFTDRTARNYMRVYKERDKLKTETVSGLKDAYMLLISPKEIIGQERGPFWYSKPNGENVQVDFEKWVNGCTNQELRFSLIEYKFISPDYEISDEERGPFSGILMEKIQHLQRVLELRSMGNYEGETCAGCRQYSACGKNNWGYEFWKDEWAHGLCEIFLWCPCLPTDPICKYQEPRK